jgi:outer membrane protein OmpA-like peptidoglycan-associated protein
VISSTLEIETMPGPAGVAPDPRSPIPDTLESLRAAADASQDRGEQVQIHARMARLFLEQDRLPEAIGAKGTAVDLAQGQVPDWVSELGRAIDTHPGRDRLSAAAIGQALAQRGIGNKGLLPTPRLDLYIYFDFDQDRPNADGMLQAQALADGLAGRPPGLSERYRLIGHTDRQGPADYNLGLSQRRAESVRRLVAARRPELAARLAREGRGETERKYPGDTPEDHRLNRRVEVRVGP